MTTPAELPAGRSRLAGKVALVVGGGLVPAADGGGDADDVMVLAPPAAAQPATVRITALTTAATPQPIARTI